MKDIRLHGAKVFLLVLLFLSFSPSHALGRDDSSLDSVTLQLKWYHQFQFAGYYAAKHKGFFEQAGLDVNIEQGGMGISVYDEVRSGRAQYGTNGAEILLERGKGQPFVVLAVIFQHSPSALLVLDSSGITTPQALVGKKIMLSKEGEPDLWAMLLNEGVGRDMFQWVKPTWNIQELIDGKIDATAAYLTNTPYSLKEQGVKYFVIQPSHYGVDFYGDGLFTSEEELEEHPDRVRRFRKACLEGWEYAMQHPEEMLTLIKEEYQSKKSLSHLEFEAEAMQKLIMPHLIQLGHINPGRWRYMAETYASLGMMDVKGEELDELLDGFIYAPLKKADYSRLLTILGLVVVVCFVLGGAAVLLYVFNRRLQNEIRERSSAENALRHSEQKFRNVYAGLPIPMFTWQAQGEWFVLVDYNTAGNELTNENFREYLGRRASDIYPEMPEIYDDLRTCLVNKRTEQRTFPYISPGVEEEIIVTSTYAFIPPDMVLMHVENVTTREKAKEALLQAKDEAEKSRRLQGELISNTSHELRTPINAIHGMVQLLEDADLDEEQHDYITTIKDATGHLTSRIDDILELSKIESGAVCIIDDIIALKSVIQSAVAPLTAEAENKGVALGWEVCDAIPEMVVGDGVRLRQVLFNLASNAVKFTHHGGEVDIQIKAYHDDGQSEHGDTIALLFTIRDTGIGIESEDMARIFSPFTQADGALSRRFGGAGLGLSIAKRLVENMGGEMSVTSVPGEGSEFSFVVRLGKADEFEGRA